MEFLNAFLQGDSSTAKLAVLVVSIMVGFHVAVLGFSAFCSKLAEGIAAFMDRTEWTGDNKLHALLLKLAGGSQAVAGFLGKYLPVLAGSLPKAKPAAEAPAVEVKPINPA
jgi:hypothetical protein